MVAPTFTAGSVIKFVGAGIARPKGRYAIGPYRVHPESPQSYQAPFQI